MKRPFVFVFGRATALQTVIRGAALGLIFMPLSAAAEMDTVDRSALAGLEEVQNSGYMEFYQHPELGSFQFKSIYIEPVRNEMPVRQIYDLRLRPEYIDALAADLHATMLEAFDATGLLTDEPDEDTLVISPALTFVTEYDEQTTGSHLGGARVQDRIRGNTIMEMTWRAGPGGTMVAAIRDGRTPHIYAPVSDRDDRFTDARDTFGVWATEFASFFGPAPSAEMN